MLYSSATDIIMLFNTMSTKEDSKILLSGEHSRRRGYLTSVIFSMNGLAIMATISIWGFFVNWDAYLGENTSHELFATQIAWASMLSSLFLGLWRLYMRYLDGATIRLYPVLYRCERELIPEEICTIKPPNKVQSISKDDVSDTFDWITVHYKDFGGRGHGVLDCFACVLIIAFGFITVIVAKNLNVIEFRMCGDLHTVTYLLSGNIIGLVLVLIGWLLWRNKEVKWPIPKTHETNQKERKAQPIAPADVEEPHL